MAVRIAAALITLGFHIAVAVVVLVFMLVIMNGFSESDAQWGIYAYIGLAVVITLVMTAAAALIANRLGKRELHGVLVTLISAGAASAVGAALVSVSGFVGVVIADIVRRKF